MTDGVNYGETIIKKYPLINDNLLRVQSILSQVIPEGLKQRLPLVITKNLIIETSDETPDVKVNKDTLNMCYNQFR